MLIGWSGGGGVEAKKSANRKGVHLARERRGGEGREPGCGKEEIRIYMNPSVERGDGDTDRDTGDKKYKKIFCVADPEPGSWIQGSKQHRILEPGCFFSLYSLSVFSCLLYYSVL